MSKETLSMREAGSVIEKINNILAGAINKMQTKNDDFVKQISLVWEDQNAVDYMKVHQANLLEMVRELEKNNKIYADAIKNIALAYAKTGAMVGATVGVEAAKLPATFGISQVQNHFETGDEFGFKNPESGADQVMDAFSTLVREVGQIAGDAVSQIKGINAFGNTDVQLNLAQSAGTMIGILKDHLDRANTQIRQYVDATARAYMKVGSSAADAAKLGAETVSGQSGMNSVLEETPASK